MTNGEKLQSVFPDTKIITQFDNPFGDRFMLFTLNDEDMQVNMDWWNAEYKEPTIQERQAESDRWQKAFDDGYQNGYSQASFDCRQDLDKIRAEIEQYWKYCDDNIQTPTLRGVKQIIDKYKGETEET